MSESTLVKMPHCWKSHVAAHLGSLPPCLLRKICHLIHFETFHFDIFLNILIFYCNYPV